MLSRVPKPRPGKNRTRRTQFPHGFSAAEPLVPPSADGSTPITDALPRSILLDPTSYRQKRNPRAKPPSKDPTARLSPLERQIILNPFGTTLQNYTNILSQNPCLQESSGSNSSIGSTQRFIHPSQNSV